MADFFVIRAERGRGVGYAVAQDTWQRFPGPWEVGVLPNNRPAFQFWSKSIARFLNRTVEPVRFDCGEESRNLFLFESPGSTMMKQTSMAADNLGIIIPT